MTQEINFVSSGAPQRLDWTAGTPGESAYQVWLDAGNTGTEADFLASLKGVKGDTGTSGPSGDSAYQLAVARGYEGTVDQWLASLKGTAGTNAVYHIDDLPSGLAVVIPAASNGTYPARSSFTNDRNRVVIWRGPDPPPNDAIPGVDMWLKPQIS